LLDIADGEGEAAHTWSGIEMALWDHLGKASGEPVWRLISHERAIARTPYASLQFSDSPARTLDRRRETRGRGFRLSPDFRRNDANNLT
jgi:L-alanine-DL-glutamate epimerase-like enolase superfamily enzyme